MRSVLVLFLFIFSSYSQDSAIIAPNARIHPESAKNGMVASQDEQATNAALEILKKGGNAADAAVAMAYVLAVTQPKAGNLGGGGFALYYEAKSGKTFAIDFRESAPAKSFEKMYLDKDGNVLPNESRFTLKATGVPGTVAGLARINKDFGTVSHKELLTDAIRLAEQGFPISAGLAHDLQTMKKPLLESPEAAKLFFEDGEPLQRGDTLKQPTLAKTLKLLANKGPQDFYTGEIAKEFSSYSKENNGLISEDDLKNYKVRILDPIKGTYRGHEVLAMPPPSSGGIHIVQMLNILEHWNLQQAGQNSAQTIHLMAESMKLAYADRSKFLGDPDFSQIPIKGLISKEYASDLRKKIKLHQATPSKEINPGKPAAYESPDTTHFSIADKEGNVISFTYTINFSFGSRIIIPSLGFFLNNEMDDFSSKPGIPNAYGLIGGEANKIEPGKRPLSSMTPVIVFKNNKPWLVTGSPGGSRIISTVLQIIVNLIDHKMNLASATMAPRLHHQWLPDKLRIEEGFSPDSMKILELKGHKVSQEKNMGCAESILIQNGFFYGFSDPRRIDGKAAGY